MLYMQPGQMDMHITHSGQWTQTMDAYALCIVNYKSRSRKILHYCHSLSTWSLISMVDWFYKNIHVWNKERKCPWAAQMQVFISVTKWLITENDKSAASWRGSAARHFSQIFLYRDNCLLETSALHIAVALTTDNSWDQNNFPTATAGLLGLSRYGPWCMHCWVRMM